MVVALHKGIVRRNRARSGFTLAQVVMSLFLLALLIQGVIYGYVQSTRRAEWSGRSLAAQSLAMQAIEQARAAKWDPETWPPQDELPPTNFSTVETLDLPVAGDPIYATNYVSISVVSLNPPLRQISADCVWSLPPSTRCYTNSISTLRAPDQ